MVGVPRSKGCSLCVKRRVKCDQIRPACSNCIKYGVECPGYEKGHKFVTGKHAVRPRGRGQRKSYETLLDFSSTSAAGSSLTTITTKESDSSTPTIPVTLCRPALPFVHTLACELFSRNAREDVVFSAPWFTSLLGRLGKAPVLDTALSALMLQLLGKSKSDQSEITMSRDLYGQSLGRLQKALNHPVAWKSTETLAATMVCCIYELSAGTSDPLDWMTHALGAFTLIKQRGRQCFSTALEKALLRGFRPLIIMYCLFTRVDCFLDQPKWQRLSGSLSHDTTGGEKECEGFLEPIGIVRSPWAMYHDRYFILLAKVPPVTRAMYQIREDRRHGIEPDRDQVALLVQQAGRLRSDYHAWYDGAVSGGAMEKPVEVHSQDPSSPFCTVLRYSNPWIGSVYTGYWATMLILQEALNQCQVGPDHLHHESNQELARDVLRSLEHVGSGIQGPYRMAYALRIAYEFVDLSLQMWLESVLEKYSQRYAALSPETYPRLHGKSTEHLFKDAGDARAVATITT